MRKHYSLGIGFGLLTLVFSLFAAQASAQTRPSPVPLPNPFTPIVDNANVIDAETKTKLESIYLNLKQRGDIEFAVVTVNTTGGPDIFDYSLAIARGWGIGSKQGDKAAFLLVVAIQDRKYFTQTSRHVEGDLPDGLLGQIQRQRLVPAFRQGNYSKGIFDTIQAYVATLAANRGFSVDGIDQRYAYRKEQPESEEEREKSGLTNLCIGILFVGFLLILIFAASRRGGAGRGGCLQWLFWGLLFSNLNSGGGRRGSSDWGGGGFGGGGGGFGGFGGGSTGGGGAGGSW